MTAALVPIRCVYIGSGATRRACILREVVWATLPAVSGGAVGGGDWLLPIEHHDVYCCSGRPR